MKKLIGLSLVVLFAAFSALAEGDHTKETIKGSGFDLTMANGIIVGTYNMIPMWVEKVCGDHIAGQYKIGEETKTFDVRLVEKKLTGQFNGKTIQFASLDKTNQNVMLTVGNQTVTVHFEAQSFNQEDGHYYGITFTFNGHTVFIDGKACLGSVIYYSLFLYGVTLL